MRPFEERLLGKIDQEIAEAERLLAQAHVRDPRNAHTKEVSSRLNEFLVRMREHRRKVRRSFLLQEQVH
jgi:hypothetical protein